MSNPQRSRPSSTKRDSTGSVGQNRLIDLANVPASSPNSTNPVEASEGQVSRNSSFSKEAIQVLPDSRPSTPQSQTHEPPSSSNSGGIDIPLAAGRDGSQTGGAGGGSSSSGGEHQSPSLMSVLQSPSSPPSMSYLSSLSPGPSPAGPGSGGAGPRGGSSSSSDMSGAVFTGILPGSPLNDQSFGSLSGCTVPTSSMLNASGEDGSSKEDDSIKSEPPRGASSTPDPMHPSQSEPMFLKPGEAPYSDYQTPAGREDRSPKSAKKKPKSSPWYSVLASTYKSKCEEFRKLFKTIPSNERLLMDYSCALQKDILVQGRMFITEGWLCFYANIFKWETVLTIRFKDVTAITKERTIRFIPNAIQVSTDSEKFFFTSFMSREKSFLLLFRIWQNALLEQTMPSSEYWSWVHSNYGSDLGIQGEELPADFLEAEGLDNLDNEDSTEDISESLGSEDQSYDEVFQGSKDESQTDDGDGITMTIPSQGKKEEPECALDASEDIGEFVDPLSSLDFGGKEIINETFNIPVDRLFTALYGNQHPFCKKFLEYRKCTDIEIGDWARHDSDRDKRKLSYVLHLNTSLGYKACGVEENHMFQKNWSKTGQSYIVEKEVYNKNVPYCDYFYVHTCQVLTMISPTSSRLRFIMRIEFLKSALGLVKNFIERNVESGVKQGERELVKFIRDHLEIAVPPKKRKGKKRRSQHPNRETEEKRRTEVQPQSSTQTGFLSNLTPVWFQPNSETKLSLHSTMAFISIILAVLCVFNVSLFLQLKSLEEGTSGKQVWSSAEFVQKLGELPKSEKDWTVLLQQQQQMHAKEMQKWRDIVDLCIQLIKQMETTLGELHSGISPSDAIPNIKELLHSSTLDSKAEHQTADGG
ncbi:protein Aster-B [Strongylocentrotus purpuratus]|uniref:VASt domain-containing protein n=1 Tax=Strongylocentrotus purpuratus TaxID=7668 RepID=A0A7M7NB39_STRPU|nr:protein Aster-B [Strongylocentrotus purpuratus]XP_030833717.1 protein Aster-B [Strongylocentrotus purpuratus]